jgi:hypothetical protein
MNTDFRRQEREIDRGLAALAASFRAPAPRPQSVAAIKAAMSAEAQRLRRRQRRLVTLRPLVGVAAALVLAVGLSLPRGSPLSADVFAAGENPEAFFVGWLDALGASGEQFTRLLEEDWFIERLGPAGEENGEGGDRFDSLEESLQSLERIVGA